jgi:putative flippase GtrA
MAVYVAVLRLWPGAMAEAQAAGSRGVVTAAILGWVVSVLTNYLLNERLTFGEGAAAWQSSRLARLGRYYLMAGASFLVQLALLNGSLWLVEAAGAPASALLGLAYAWRREACNLGAIALCTVINYLLARFWVFR